MLRLLYFAVAVALFIAMALWLADNPGQIRIEWLNWKAETSMALVAGVLVALLILGGFFARSLGTVVAFPFGFLRRRREARRRRGYQSLSDGLAAASTGDAEKARKYLKTADALLKDPVLTAFLSARVAMMSGDRKKAHDYFQQLLSRPETAATGLKGLLEEALAENDLGQSVSLASKAFAANPKDRSLAVIIFTLAMKMSDFQEANLIIDRAKKGKAITKLEAQRWRALVLTEQATAAARDDKKAQALETAKKAVAADPACIGASLFLARMEAEAEKKPQALSTLEAAWKKCPAQDIYVAYMGLLDEKADVLTRLRHIEKLAAANPDAVESRLLVGEAALNAKVWGQARKNLQTIIESGPNQKAYLLFARLEQEEYQNADAAMKWMKKSEDAPVYPQWTCSHCFHPAREWTLFCSDCGEIDSLVWGAPQLKPATLPALVS